MMQKRMICLVAACLFPCAAFAGALVKGSGVATIGGPIATTAEVAKVSSEVRSSIASSTQKIITKLHQGHSAIVDQLKRNGAADKEMTKKLGEQMRDLFVEFGNANARQRAEELFGEGFKPPDTCTNPDLSAQMQVGRKVERQTTAAMYGKLRHHNQGYHAVGGFERKIKAKPMEEISAEFLLPANKTLTPEQVDKAKEMAEMITNPMPATKLPPGRLNTPQGKSYEARIKIKEARLSVPQAVYAASTASYAPTLPLGEWVTNQYQDMGATGAPPEVVEGKVSAMALFEVLSSMRLANPNWDKKLQQGTEKWLLYEIARMNATQLEIQRRQLEYLQQIAMMLAQDQSEKTNQAMNPVLNNMLRNLPAANIK